MANVYGSNSSPGLVSCVVSSMWKSKRLLFLLAISFLCALMALYVLMAKPSASNKHHPHLQPLTDSVPHNSQSVGGIRDSKPSLLGQTGTHSHTGTGSSAGEGGAGGAVPLRGEKGAVMPQPLLRILVLTYKRAQSLQRCLASLNAAHYDGLPVEVEIHMDRGKEQQADNLTLHVARSFAFAHGSVKVYLRPRHGGVVGQWLASWKIPRDNTSEIAVFVEDDLTLSPFFARWLRRMHAKYDGFPGINGYSLQGETIRHAEGTDSSLMKGPVGEGVFLYPVVGSWGFSPNTALWRDFIRWYQEVSQDPKFLPLVPGLKVSGWYRTFVRTGHTDSMWTIWHICYSFKHHHYTLYPHLTGGKGLAFNWKEPGEHYNAGVMGKGLKALLMDHWPEEDLPLPEALTIVDAKGTITRQKLSPAGLVG